MKPCTWMAVCANGAVVEYLLSTEDSSGRFVEIYPFTIVCER